MSTTLARFRPGAGESGQAARAIADGGENRKRRPSEANRGRSAGPGGQVDVAAAEDKDHVLASQLRDPSGQAGGQGGGAAPSTTASPVP